MLASSSSLTGGHGSNGKSNIARQIASTVPYDSYGRAGVAVEDYGLA